MTRRTLSFLSVALVLFLLCACNTSIDKAPAFVNLAKKVADLEKAQKDSQTSVQNLYLEFENLSTDIKTLKANAQAAPVPQPVLDQIAALEKKVEEMSKAAPAKKGKEALVADSAATAPTAGTEGKPATEVKPRKKARGAASPAPSRPKGSYYSVNAGDTMESIAKAHNITPDAIAKSNHIPASAKLRSGQTIFIPR